MYARDGVGEEARYGEDRAFCAVLGVGYGVGEDYFGERGVVDTLCGGVGHYGV